MPRRLLSRVGRDTVREFRAAAAERYLDARLLAREGRRTAAIYLWGYVAEMYLKAARISQHSAMSRTKRSRWRT